MKAGYSKYAYDDTLNDLTKTNQPRSADKDSKLITDTDSTLITDQGGVLRRWA